ncbi:AfsR/SARP family transcriptional regulator [Nonomuraea phyllanthi]|uniref:BTAD domain-containing putative transcriptional regulator n=1 Tax=Nonomuraea phyllanthi TaxID=2219224 RepID=UPI001293C56D|nr:BTAD domain-containing putative transcriptional regulator [Nonomuraea phyllanthi]QFY09801.1 AfsR/SARP family transcriptional regulator [Nonomuraea phyllanthi]
MRFGVLGEVRVWTAEGRPVPVPETKVRALLADLLVHQGQPVSADRLIDDLWGDDLPANPTGALQVKVSRLRHALAQAESGGGGLVVSSAHGYLLRLEHDAVDADRFTALLARARECPDAQARLKVLEEALGLWRGPPFADFAEEPFALPMTRRLSEQHLAAMEARAEARLELGEHDLLVGELEDLVGRYPLRERLRAAQMRALYQAGRQSDALACYAELRNRLAEELGLDPSPELAALHQAILRQDPALTAPAPAASPVPLNRPRTNLPAALTDLVGRDEAVEEVCSSLKAGRMVTLTGPGGVGKTRLAIETAGRMTADYPDGVWLVELGEYGRPELGRTPAPQGGSTPERASALGMEEVALRVAAVLGIRDDTLASAMPLPAGELLAEVLADQRLLLVMDNCEHVVEAAAKLAEMLLRTAPELRILATSREPLALSGEVVWPVPALTLPDPSAGADVAKVAQAGAVRLFVERAAAGMPHFQLDATNVRQVAELCRRLDGIPLALELAATRVRAMGVHELVARLDHRFAILAAGRRDAPARHQTLRAVIDWSWDLLSAPERVVLRRLAVHPGGCTLPAAEAVCSDGAADDEAGDVTSVGMMAEDVWEVLARLVDRSLVIATDDSGGPRYRLLETVAHYGLQRLHEAGELEQIRRRFHRYYLRLAQEAEPNLHGDGQRRWLDRLDRESANLRSALEGMVHHNDATGALDLTLALVWYWFLRGRLGEACDSFDRALAASGDVPAAVRATARGWHAGVRLLTGTPRDHRMRSPTAMQAFQDIEDPRERARVQWFFGYALYSGIRDLPTSEEYVSRALATFRQVSDRWGIAAALSTAARHAMNKGDLQALEHCGEESLELFRELGDRWGQLQIIRPLTALAAINGDYAQAAQLHRDGLRMAEELRFWPEVADQLMGLGRIALLAGDFRQARQLHQQSKRVAARQNDKKGELNADIGLALTARREGDLDGAEKHLNAVLDVVRDASFASVTALMLAELGFIAEQRGDAETALVRHRKGLSAARATSDPRAVALAMEGLAGAHALAGRHDHAARLLGAASAARESVGAPLPPSERGDVNRITSAVRASLGEDAFAAAFAHGLEQGPAGYLEPDA